MSISERKTRKRSSLVHNENKISKTLKDVSKEEIILAVSITNTLKCALKLIKNIYNIDTTHISALSKKITSKNFTFRIAKRIFINTLNDLDITYDSYLLSTRKDINIFNDYINNMNDIKYKDLNLVIMYAKLIKENANSINKKSYKQIVLESGKDFKDKNNLIKVFETIISQKKTHEPESNIENKILINPYSLFQHKQAVNFNNSSENQNDDDDDKIMEKLYENFDGYRLV